MPDSVPLRPPSYRVLISKWMPASRCLAVCKTPGCDFRRARQTSVTGLARRHVEETGHHRVEITRSQWKVVKLHG